jgi:hypothetical protein|tara:strand:+ start:3820 stop:3930 length:111 start_codon:yes stop_codon:yes gene_type:complete
MEAITIDIDKYPVSHVIALTDSHTYLDMGFMQAYDR